AQHARRDTKTRLPRKLTLVLTVGTDRQFSRLCATLGASPLARDDRFVTNELRVQNRQGLRESLESALAPRPAHHWTKELTAQGVPAGAVNNIADAFPLATELGLAPVADTADGDPRLGRRVANPISLSGTPVTYRTRAPHLGEHSADIRNWLDELETRRDTA
ncbi:CoA transferase, partial [Rhodococcus sp. T2V]|uniref:CoA transferase n=1 Tax=Rhodococcus sp. T2V TaxID=3034164 RepID=UPI0023E2F6B1